MATCCARRFVGGRANDGLARRLWTASARRGIVSLGNRTWLDTSAGIDVPPERRRVGDLFQEYALFPHLDVLGDRPVRCSTARTVDDLLERFQIAHLMKARVRDLSGGERQRVALARALALDPGVLLLDGHCRPSTPTRRPGPDRTARAAAPAPSRPSSSPTIEDAAALADRVGVIVDGDILSTAQQRARGVAGRSFRGQFPGATLLEGTAGRVERPHPGRPTSAAWPGRWIGSGPGRARHLSLGGLAFRELSSDSAVNHIRATVASVVPLGNRARTG